MHWHRLDIGDLGNRNLIKTFSCVKSSGFSQKRESCTTATLKFHIYMFPKQSKDDKFACHCTIKFKGT